MAGPRCPGAWHHCARWLRGQAGRAAVSPLCDGTPGTDSAQLTPHRAEGAAGPGLLRKDPVTPGGPLEEQEGPWGCRPLVTWFDGRCLDGAVGRCVKGAGRASPPPREPFHLWNPTRVDVRDGIAQPSDRAPPRNRGAGADGPPGDLVPQLLARPLRPGTCLRSPGPGMSWAVGGAPGCEGHLQGWHLLRFLPQPWHRHACCQPDRRQRQRSVKTTGSRGALVSQTRKRAQRRALVRGLPAEDGGGPGPVSSRAERAEGDRAPSQQGRHGGRTKRELARVRTFRGSQGVNCPQNRTTGHVRRVWLCG